MSAGIPIRRLAKKTQRQLCQSIKTPPSEGPVAAATAPDAAPRNTNRPRKKRRRRPNRSARRPAGTSAAANTIAELAAADPAVASRAAESFERTTGLLRSALERGVRSGELEQNLDAEATARYLANTLNGLRLLVKVTDRKVADDIVAVTLRTLA